MMCFSSILVQSFYVYPGNNGIPPCSFNITVRDTTPPYPTSALPDDISVSTAPDGSTATVSWLPYSFGDNVIVASVTASVSVFPC